MGCASVALCFRETLSKFTVDRGTQPGIHKIFILRSGEPSLLQGGQIVCTDGALTYMGSEFICMHENAVKSLGLSNLENAPSLCAESKDWGVWISGRRYM